MIGSLLIANRGEIACRIIATARRLGVRTIAVYADADAGALHVARADDRVRIGPSPARESYLDVGLILAAARDTNADAIHPGYGFLSENAEFAQAVIDAGLIWVGPAPASIHAMGLKDAAKARMIAAGVPVTPGYLGADQDPDRLAAEAAAIGWPVLIKAVAGGGGKGMRRVDAAAAFAESLISCRREAAASFGDDRVLIEKYIATPRHIEVQVFGDRHGNIVHLFERDCSLQRRHQKVIEEAPAPGMDDATRAAVCGAAVAAARAVDYVGAGTVEFIADAGVGLSADRIWFMEMNTRLQVEHPVTEAITGVDLVEWQLRIAGGEALPLRQDELMIGGWAIEARLYAEDPATGFLPSTGRLTAFNVPDGVRCDTGVAAGSMISAYYDPMIAKLIAHGDDREVARRQLAEALSRTIIAPVRSNAGFLMRTLDHPAFVAGTADTGLIAREIDTLLPAALPSPAALADATRTIVGSQGLAGFRLNRAAQSVVHLMLDGAAIDVPGGGAGGATLVRPAHAGGPRELIITEAGQSWRLGPLRVGPGSRSGEADDALLAPMPGRIIAVEVTEGETVVAGQKILTLEAMKMEHSLVAPFGGIVAGLDAVVGAQVGHGALLARIQRP